MRAAAEVTGPEILRSGEAGVMECNLLPCLEALLESIPGDGGLYRQLDSITRSNSLRSRFPVSSKETHSLSSIYTALFLVSQRAGTFPFGGTRSDGTSRNTGRGGASRHD